MTLSSADTGPATETLNAGASLEEVAQLLRPDGVATTVVYDKTDPGIRCGHPGRHPRPSPLNGGIGTGSTPRYVDLLGVAEADRLSGSALEHLCESASTVGLLPIGWPASTSACPGAR